MATVFKVEGREGIAGVAAAADVAGAAGVLVLEDVGGGVGEDIDAAVMPARSQGFGGEACAMFIVLYLSLIHI